MKRVLIIGYGVVGKNMHKIFKHADILDPLKGYYNHGNNHKYDVAFVCVPTEKKINGSCDISIVRNVIMKSSNIVDVFCIKSTIPPGTTKKYFNNNSVFSPEYFGETIHSNGAEYDFVTLGGTPVLSSKVAEVFKEVVHSNTKFLFTDSKTAELCKYMENCWLAAKVTFCNEFYRIANKLGVNYNELRELWLMDPRINRSHTFVYENTPYYESHCLDKDIPALISFANSNQISTDFMKSVFEVNKKHKSEITCMDNHSILS